MTAIASALQQRCRGRAAGFCAASARSAKIEFTVWARLRHLRKSVGYRKVEGLLLVPAPNLFAIAETA